MLRVRLEGEEERNAKWWEYPILLPIFVFYMGFVAVLMAVAALCLFLAWVKEKVA